MKNPRKPTSSADRIRARELATRELTDVTGGRPPTKDGNPDGTPIPA